MAKIFDAANLLFMVLSFVNLNEVKFECEILFFTCRFFFKFITFFNLPKNY